ncbi:hypothetical protein TWF970_001732 [Orbilia oligospora]|uniref:Secreted protein n=1 Tax=Orbilia oligospora TaxID=2813651 RepID=A0A7C8V9Y9_ORBOL|nr:hypothetical protein TWF970_001732 [Orbilia oligospora]
MLIKSIVTFTFCATATAMWTWNTTPNSGAYFHWRCPTLGAAQSQEQRAKNGGGCKATTIAHDRNGGFLLVNGCNNEPGTGDGCVISRFPHVPTGKTMPY